jgi:hypothetical protein
MSHPLDVLSKGDSIGIDTRKLVNIAQANRGAEERRARLSDYVSTARSGTAPSVMEDDTQEGTVS